MLCIIIVCMYRWLCNVQYTYILFSLSLSQQSSHPNILLVTNLPKHTPHKKVSSRLGQLSDNCGGRVLGVDPASGTARILFRTHEWAVK